MPRYRDIKVRWCDAATWSGAARFRARGRRCTAGPSVVPLVSLGRGRLPSARSPAECPMPQLRQESLTASPARLSRRTLLCCFALSHFRDSIWPFRTIGLLDPDFVPTAYVLSQGVAINTIVRQGDSMSSVLLRPTVLTLASRRNDPSRDGNAERREGRIASVVGNHEAT